MLPKNKLSPVMAFLSGIQSTSILAGPPLGGFLYESGCWALPFTLGAAILCCNSLLFAFAAPFLPPEFNRPGKKPKHMETGKDLDTSPCTLICKPGIPLLMFPMAVSVGLTTMVQPQWQQYLGSPPFSMTPGAIGDFMLVSAVTMLVALPFAGWLSTKLGCVVMFVVGNVIEIWPVLLIGPTKIVSGFIPQTIFVNGVGVCLMGFFGAWESVTFAAVQITLFEASGYPKESISTFSSALNQFLFGSCAVLGPLLGSALQAAVSFQWEVTIVFITVVCVTYPMLFVLWMRYAESTKCYGAGRSSGTGADSEKKSE